MNTPHILNEIVGRPLLVAPDKLQAILGVINRKNSGHLDLDLSALLPLLGTDKNGGAIKAETRPVKSSDAGKQVAVISIIGSLCSRNYGFDDGSGLRSYRTIGREIEICLADSSVVGIVLDFDSYGGAAAGCSRLAKFIKEADLQKPIYASIDLNCFSAANWIASACRKTYLTDGDDAGMGSVGCIAIHRDVSGKNQKEGEVYTAVYFGAKKNEFSPHEPLSSSLHEKMQASVNHTGMAFASAVAENRGLDLQKVLAMQAGVYYGQDAVNIGLADGIATLAETVAMVAEEAQKQQGQFALGLPSSQKTEGQTMSTKEQLEALCKAEDGPAALAKLGYITKESAEKEKVDAVASAVADQKKLHSEVLALAVLADANTLQTKALLEQEGITTASASSQLQQMRADKRTTIFSTISSNAGDGKHGLIAAAEKIAKQA